MLIGINNHAIGQFFIVFVFFLKKKLLVHSHRGVISEHIFSS